MSIMVRTTERAERMTARHQLSRSRLVLRTAGMGQTPTFSTISVRKRSFTAAAKQSSSEAKRFNDAVLPFECRDLANRLGMPRNSARGAPGRAKSSAILNQIVLRVLASN
jgi:hypothetical protein